MRLPFLFVAAIAAPSLAVAQPQTASPAGPGDVKVNQLIVYGDDPCPPSTAQEVTVCGRMSESDRYRIPPNLRGTPNDPASTSWTQKAMRLELAGRTGVGSCSPSGPGGGVGCLNQLIQQWAQDTGMDDGINWTALVENARRERLSTIDSDSEAIERREVSEGR